MRSLDTLYNTHAWLCLKYLSTEKLQNRISEIKAMLLVSVFLEFVVSHMKGNKDYQTETKRCQSHEKTMYNILLQ